MAKARLIRNGKALCETCGARIPYAACIKCGKNTRTLNNQGEALCRSCRTLDRSCQRCGKPVPAAGRLVDGGAVCPSCSKHYREPQACDQCGKMSRNLSGADTEVGRQRLCGICFRRHKGFKTCGICRKDRFPAGVTADGKAICKRCLAADGKPFVCPQCGQVGIHHSNTRCQQCYVRDTAKKRIAEYAPLLKQAWVRDTWLAFAEELQETMRPARLMHRVNHFYLFFVRLDLTFSNPSEITPIAFLKCAGGLDGLRRFSVPYGYLLKQRIVPETTRNLLEDEAELIRQEALIAKLGGKWYAPVITRYRNHLLTVRARYDSRGWKGDDVRMKARTITLNLRAARRLCEMLDAMGVQMIQQTAPEMLDKFFMDYPGLATSIRAFVRYLNRKEKLFQRLGVKTVHKNLPEWIFLPREKTTALIQEWMTPSDEMLRHSLIGLFMLLYGQTIKNCVRLRLDALTRRADGRYRIAFSRAEIHLDARISALLERYLNLRQTLATLDDADENPYLFPGRHLGRHIGANAVTHWLKKADVSADQLFATSIYNAYQNGLRLPKVLVRAFGISIPTAMKYLNMLDPRLVMEIERKSPIGREAAV